MADTGRAEEDGTEIVKWYTRARRFPQLIGKTPDGATIWGGPYTYTQVIAGVGVIVIGSKTTWLWGHFGVVANAVILLGIAYGLVLALGRLPIGSRNPLSVSAGVIRAMSAPTHGRLAGAPVRVRRPHQSRTKLVISPTPHPIPAAAAAQAPAPPQRSTPSKQRALPAQAPSRQTTRARPASTDLRPTPAGTHLTPPPALSGVQLLLASVPPRDREM